jgi:hypothetical protein
MLDRALVDVLDGAWDELLVLMLVVELALVSVSKLDLVLAAELA